MIWKGSPWRITVWGGIAFWVDVDFRQAKSLFEQSLSLYQEIGDKESIGIINSALGLVTHHQGNFPAAIEYFQRAVAVQRDIGNPRSLGGGLNYLGCYSIIEGDNVLARPCLLEALALFQVVGDPVEVTNTHLMLAKLAWAEGDRELAARKLADALASSLWVDEPNSADYKYTYHDIAVPDLSEKTLKIQNYQIPDLTANLLTFQSTLAWADGDLKGAESGLKEALKAVGKISPMISGGHGATWAMDKLAQMKTRQQPERAARLFGAVEGLNRFYVRHLDPAEKASRQAVLDELKAILGEQRMAALWVEGMTMTSDQAIAYALEEEENTPA